VNISLGAGEILTCWHHMKLTIPAELWGHITHILVYLWGILLDGGMTEREIKSLPVLPLYLRLDIPSNLSRAPSCLRLSGHNFLVQRSVMTGIEGLMSSGSVTDVTGILFRMRNTFCWTVRMIIWSDFAHSISSSSHLSLRMAQLVWGPLWPTWYFWCCLFCS